MRNLDIGEHYRVSQYSSLQPTIDQINSFGTSSEACCPSLDCGFAMESQMQDKRSNHNLQEILTDWSACREHGSEKESDDDPVSHCQDVHDGISRALESVTEDMLHGLDEEMVWIRRIHDGLGLSMPY